MNIYEAAWTEALEQELIRLSADWEGENSTWGYRANTHEDLAGRRVFLAEEDGFLCGYLFGLRETAEKKTSFMPLCWQGKNLLRKPCGKPRNFFPT